MNNHKLEYELFNNNYEKIFNKLIIGGSNTENELDNETTRMINRIQSLEAQYNDKLNILNELIDAFLNFTGFPLDIIIDKAPLSVLDFTYDTTQSLNSTKNKIDYNSKILYKNIDTLINKYNLLNNYYTIINKKFTEFENLSTNFKNEIISSTSYQNGGLLLAPKQESEPEPISELVTEPISEPVFVTGSVSETESESNKQIDKTQIDSNEDNLDIYEMKMLNLNIDETIKSSIKNIIEKKNTIRKIFFDFDFNIKEE